MSLILDALKQAELERRIGRPPDVSVALRMQSRTSPRRWPWLLMALLVVGALFALVFRSEPPSSTISKTFEPPAGIRRDPAGEAGDASTLSSPRTAEREGDHPQRSHRPVTLQRAQNFEVETEAKIVVPPPPTSSRRPETGTENPVVDSPNRPASNRMETAEEAWEPSGDKTNAGSTAVEQLSEVQDEALPLASELPPDIRASFQKLEISAHVYHADPSRRFVFINLHSYRAGDRILDTELILNEITPEEIVIEYGKGRARLPVKRSSLW